MLMLTIPSSTLIGTTLQKGNGGTLQFLGIFFSSFVILEILDICKLYTLFSALQLKTESK